MHILGLDIGTSGVKAALFDSRFKPVARSYREYPLISVGRESFDLDANVVWDRTREAIRELHQRTGKGIDAVAVSAIGDVVIALDRGGETLRPSILDFDPRGREEIRQFIENIGTEVFFDITGMPPLHINSLAKILWIKSHEPQVYGRVAAWASYEDFILRRLGAVPAMSYSMAARTMLFDRNNHTWSDQVLREAGIDRASLPQAMPSGVVVGKVGRDAVRELGFLPDAVACSGAHDMVCAAIGAGLDEKDTTTALNIVGTMEGIVVFTGQPVKRDEMLKRLYPCFPGYRENVSLSVNLTSGSILKWYRDEVSSQSGRSSGGGSFDEILSGIDVNGPGDLLLIPHFAGTCNPRFNPDARGLVYGLSLHSSMRDMVQGILEGLCYELRLHIQGLKEAGIHIGKLKAVGGGSQSPSWLQLKANITGLEVIGSDAHEASSMGAAGLCGSALGLLESPFAVGQAAEVHECVYMPKADAGGAFEEKYAQYVELVARLYGEN